MPRGEGFVRASRGLVGNGNGPDESRPGSLGRFAVQYINPFAGPHCDVFPAAHPPSFPLSLSLARRLLLFCSGREDEYRGQDAHQGDPELRPGEQARHHVLQAPDAHRRPQWCRQDRKDEGPWRSAPSLLSPCGVRLGAPAFGPLFSLIAGV